MAIQELDLKIKHHSGQSNSNTDALSRSPLPSGEGQTVSETDGVIAHLETREDADYDDLPAQQCADQDLAAIIKYLETGILPQDERQAQTLLLSSSQYVLEDDVLSRWRK